MNTYKYSAISKSGSKVSGVVEGFNELDAVDRIKESCDIVLKIQEVKEKTGILSYEIDGNKLNSKAFTMMCSQFAIILRSGVPIARTVDLIAQKTTDKKLKKMLNQMAGDVEAGRSVSDAFAERGEKFMPQTFIETIRAGEESGNLDKAFETMYEHYDKQTKMHAKVVAALRYPLFVIAIAVVVVIVLMAYVVPQFTVMFADYGAELPLITRMLIGISNFFRKYILVIAGIIAVILLAFKLYGNTETGRVNLSKLQLKLPILGNIASLSAASEFANTMTTLMGAGLGMTRALTITAKVISNYHVSQEIGKIAGLLEEGRTLGESLRKANVLPDILVDMTAVGEETGEMESTLHTVAAYYDAELQVAVDSAVAKLEPALLIFIAVVAGFIVLAIYMAMFSLYAAM